MINDATTLAESGSAEAYETMSCARANCTNVWHHGAMLMRTTRDVNAGEELYFSYGALYWATKAQ